MQFQNYPLNYTITNPTVYHKHSNKQPQPQYQYGCQYKLQYRNKQQQHEDSLQIVNPQVNGIDGLLCSLDQGIQNKQVNGKYSYNHQPSSVNNNIDVRPQAKFYLNQQQQQQKKQQQQQDDDTSMLLQMVAHNYTLQQQIQQLLNQLNKQTQQTQLIMADMSANNLKISELRKIYQQKHEQSKKYDNILMKQKHNYVYKVQDKYNNNININSNNNNNNINKQSIQLHRQQISLDQPINNTYTLQYPKQKYQLTNTNTVNSSININSNNNNSMNNSINNSIHVYHTYGKTMNNSVKGQCSTTTPQGTLASSSTLYSFYNNNNNNNNKKDINNVSVAQFTVFDKPHTKAKRDHNNDDDNQIDSFHNLLLDDLNNDHSLWGHNTKQNTNKLVKAKSHNQQNYHQYQHETSKLQKLFRNTMPVSMLLQNQQHHQYNKHMMTKSINNNNDNCINNSNNNNNSNSKAVYKKITPTASWNQNNIIINNKINMYRKVSHRIDKTIASNQRISSTYQAHQQQQNKHICQNEQYNEQVLQKAKNSTPKYKRISIFANMSTNTNNSNTQKSNNNTSNADKPRQSRPSSTTTTPHNPNKNLNPYNQYPKTNTVNNTMMTPNHKQYNTDTNIYKQQSSKTKDSARNRSMKLVNIDVRNCK